MSISPHPLVYFPVLLDWGVVNTLRLQACPGNKRQVIAKCSGIGFRNIAFTQATWGTLSNPAYRTLKFTASRCFAIHQNLVHKPGGRRYKVAAYDRRQEDLKSRTSCERYPSYMNIVQVYFKDKDPVCESQFCLAASDPRPFESKS
jgi:hypothetical protein